MVSRYPVSDHKIDSKQIWSDHKCNCSISEDQKKNTWLGLDYKDLSFFASKYTTSSSSSSSGSNGSDSDSVSWMQLAAVVERSLSIELAHWLRTFHLRAEIIVKGSIRLKAILPCSQATGWSSALLWNNESYMVQNCQSGSNTKKRTCNIHGSCSGHAKIFCDEAGAWFAGSQHGIQSRYLARANLGPDEKRRMSMARPGR